MADNFTIESQRQTLTLTGAGTFKNVWEIRFSTPAGTHAMIQVDERNYNAEFVRGAIEDYVAHIQAVENL